MRLGKAQIKKMYEGGEAVIECIERLKPLINTYEGLDRSFAKRVRGWLVLCYKVESTGYPKAGGGLCEEWLRDPQKAIDHMKTLTNHGCGVFKRPSSIDDFGPDNLVFISREDKYVKSLADAQLSE